MRYCCRQAPESLQTANLNLQQRDARRAALPNNNAVRIKRSGLHFLVKRTHTNTLCICLSVCMGVWEWVRERARENAWGKYLWRVFHHTKRFSVTIHHSNIGDMNKQTTPTREKCAVSKCQNGEISRGRVFHLHEWARVFWKLWTRIGVIPTRLLCTPLLTWHEAPMAAQKVKLSTTGTLLLVYWYRLELPAREAKSRLGPNLHDDNVCRSHARMPTS